MNVFTQAELATKIHMLNGVWGKKNSLTITGPVKADKPAKPSSIQQFFDDHSGAFDSHREMVAQLVTMITGEKIQLTPEDAENVRVIKGIILVHTVDDGDTSHNIVGQPMLSIEPKHPQYAQSDGTEGNVGPKAREVLRLATKAEITKFVKDWDDSGKKQSVIVQKLAAGMEAVNGE